MDSLPDKLLNKDQNERTGHEGEKSGFQQNPTILEALQANTLMTESLRKQTKDLKSKQKKTQTCVFLPSRSVRKYKAMTQTIGDWSSQKEIKDIQSKDTNMFIPP